MIRRAAGNAFMAYIYLVLFVAVCLASSGIIILLAHLIGINVAAAH